MPCGNDVGLAHVFSTQVSEMVTGAPAEPALPL
jgi:hypothetical protein